MTLHTAWLIVSVITWLTPLPTHAQGRLVRYGPQWLIEANAEFRSYDLAPYRDRCGLAVMSPADLGKIVWVRLPGEAWYGPCLAVDVAMRKHFYQYVEVYREVAELGDQQRRLLGNWPASTWGEVFVGACPPAPSAGQPQPYRLAQIQEGGPHASFYPYPPQQRPRRDCGPRARSIGEPR